MNHYDEKFVTHQREDAKFVMNAEEVEYTDKNKFAKDSVVHFLCL